MQLITKISEIDEEKREHQLVLEALTNTQPERKCWKYVGTALVEKTAADIIPDLKETIEGIEQLIQKLYEAYNSKEEQIREFEIKYGVKTSSTASGGNKTSGDKNST